MLEAGYGDQRKAKCGKEGGILEGKIRGGMHGGGQGRSSGFYCHAK